MAINPFSFVPVRPVSVQLPSADMEKIYDSVPRTEDVFNLNRKDLELSDKLGDGNFGSVMKGTFKRLGKVIPVAVKTLKTCDMPSAEVEIKIFASFFLCLYCFKHLMTSKWND